MNEQQTLKKYRPKDDKRIRELTVKYVQLGRFLESKDINLKKIQFYSQQRFEVYQQLQQEIEN